MDTTTLPPACWRSEAFAEDLLDDDDGRVRQPAGGAGLRRVVLPSLLGVAPFLMAKAGALVAPWGSTAS